MLNNVSIVGRLVRDIDLKFTQTGTAIGKISIAVQDDYKDKSTGKYGTDYIDITFWGKQAEFVAEYCGAKGLLIAIKGRLKQERWEKDGRKNSKITIKAEQAYPIEWAGQKQKQQEQETSSEGYSSSSLDIRDEDVPF